MTAGCLSTSATLLPQPVTSGRTGKVKICCRYSSGNRLRRSGRHNARNLRQSYNIRQRLLVTSYAEYDRGAAQYRSRFSSTTPNGVSSAVQTISFNQQLLIVLSIPAIALGLPLVLGHPIVFIVIPFLVYKTPALYNIVEPLVNAVLQSVLSGLRPSGSPRSGGFPWQQSQQPREGAWSSSPPIDVEYRYLPADSATDQYSQTEAPAATPSTSQTQAPSATESERYTTYEQPSTSYAATQSYSSSRQQVSYDTPSRQQVSFDTPSRQQASFDTPSRQQFSFKTSSRQRVTLDREYAASRADNARSRSKVTIKPQNRHTRQNGRVVRQAAPGQVGVNVSPGAPVITEPNSNLVRALLGLFPFLRHWGGFV